MKMIKVRDVLDTPVTAEVLAQAIERGKKRSASSLRAISVKYSPKNKALSVVFADGIAVVLPIKAYAEFVDLGARALNRLTVGYGGTAICLDDIDLHVSIVGLVSASKSLMDMATTMVAARNGSLSSAKKVQSSRSNGLKGGRPRKLATALSA